MDKQMQFLIYKVADEIDLSMLLFRMKLFG